MEETEHKNWLARNWPWLIPAGCAGMVLLLVLVAAAIIFVAFAAVKSSDVYQQALVVIEKSPSIKQLVGEPVKAGFFIQGKVHTSNTGGEASFTIPVKGPEGKGVLHVEAQKQAGGWRFTKLDFEHPKSRQIIDLLETKKLE